MATLTNVPGEITAGNTTNNELTINGGIGPDEKGQYLLFIEADSANTGTIQFNVGAAATGRAWSASDKLPPVTVDNGVNKLNFKQTVSSDKFIVSY